VAAPVVVILAAGQGTRMRSAVQKLLHPLCGRPIIAWPIAAARAAGASKVVVVDSPGRPLAAALTDWVAVADGAALSAGRAGAAAGDRGRRAGGRGGDLGERHGGGHQW
jgi:bifunctional UDP-N-acetylglucosamine pyrophosphorylase/glucosamine-1-phosphate N-acetyltransferase